MFCFKNVYLSTRDDIGEKLIYFMMILKLFGTFSKNCHGSPFHTSLLFSCWNMFGTKSDF